MITKLTPSSHQIQTLSIAVPCPLPQLFNYLPNAETNLKGLKPGIRIKIPFGKRTLIGIFVQLEECPSVDPKKLRSIIEVIDDEPIFNNSMLAFFHWISRYYHYPIGAVFNITLPTLLRKGLPAELNPKIEKTIEVINDNVEAALNLNQEQANVVEVIAEKLTSFSVFLIDGVTGSGKTEIYFHIIAKQLKRNKQVLLLVPEIGLTPQTINRFQQRFSDPIAIIHSDITDKARLKNWILAKNNKVKIIIGTRSAIFTPMPNLGLIIVDEEHDPSFKQQDTLRYSARDTAIVLAKQINIPIILASATPSLESYYNAQQKKYIYLKLTKRAGIATLPDIKLVDIRDQKLEAGLSSIVLRSIQSHLNNNNQVLLFLNRRGYAPNLICHHCGYNFKCPRCDVSYTYHKEKSKLVCHHCEKQIKLPTDCTKCKSHKLLPLGLGTERIEAALAKHFPNDSIVRIDRDSTRKKGSFNQLLEKINSGVYKILIGTQMLAKGHHFPNVTLVVVINVDSGLLSNDLRASERMGQLVMQVAGRSGRADKPGEVLIQTRQPDNSYLTCLLEKNYQAFCNFLLQQRKVMQMPPFSFLALFRAEALTETNAYAFLNEIKNQVHVNDNRVSCLGPIAAPLQKKAGKFRAQLVLQANHRNELQSLLDVLIPQIPTFDTVKKVKWSVDIDPIDFF